MVLLISTLNLVQILFYILKVLLQTLIFLFKFLFLREFVTPTLQLLDIFLALLDLPEQNLETTHLLLQFVFSQQQLLYLLVRLIMLLPILLEVTIQVKRKIESKFMLIFGCLTLFFVKVSPVEIKEQIFRFVFNKSTFFVGASIELNLKVKLLVEGSVKIACSRVQDQACEIVDDRLFFLH